jgi:membrane-bound lytic murein transglycosylase F
MRTSFVTILHLALLVAIQIFLVSLLVRPGVPSDVFRVAHVPDETTISRLSPYGPGFDRELVERFCRKHHLVPRWTAVHSPAEGLDALQAGRVDMFIHTGEPLGPQPDHDLAAGPTYRGTHPVLIHNKWKQDLLQPRDLCDYSLPVVGNPPMLTALTSLSRVIGCRDMASRTSQQSMHDLLEQMTRDRIRFGLVGATAFKLWQPFFPELRTSLELHHHLATRWIWNNRTGTVGKWLAAFWKDLPASPFFRELKARYFGFLPQTTDFYELSHLTNILASKLPRYGPTIAQAARENHLDPLLVTALIYQESHFNARARSKTGVRGLLQISQNTARELGISNRLDPLQSIEGGVRYLRSLMDRLTPLGLDSWNTLFFALAAYNQGMGHLRDAMTLAEERGRNKYSWQDVKEVFPLLSYRKYYEEAAHGYCRGIEAVDYVDSIRYYYYYLTGLVRLGRPESALLALVTEATPTSEAVDSSS